MDTILSPNIAFILTLALFAILLIVPAIVVPLSIRSARRKRRNKKFSDGEPWVFALGEKENIKEVSATRSRLSVVLVDNEKIDKELLKKLGVSSILTMSNKITLLIEEKAEEVAASIQKSL